MAEANKVVQLKPRAATKTPKKAATKKAATKKPVAKKTAPKAAVKKTTAKKTIKKAAPKKTATKPAAKKTTKKAVAKKPAAKKTATKKVAAAKAAAKTITAKKKTVKAKATKKTATKATKATKKPVVKKAAVKKKAAKKTAPKKTVKKAAKKAAKKSVAKKAIAKKAVAKKSPVKKTVRKTTAKKAAPKIAARLAPTAPQIAPQPQTLFQPPKPTNPFNTKPLEAIMTQPNFEQAQKQFDDLTKEAANLNREGIDAFVKSGTIFAKGFESLMKETMSFAQSTAEKQMQLAKDAMTSKTINEFSDAQNKLAQTSFDDFMSGTTKITELGVKLLSEAIEPINEQVQKSVQKATDAVAAE